jgi:hypothetical protein
MAKLQMRRWQEKEISKNKLRIKPPFSKQWGGIGGGYQKQSIQKN